MTSPSVEHVSGKCVQCDACSQVVIETVPGRGQGWKCPECGWWYWLQEPKKVTHAKADLDRLEALAGPAKIRFPETVEVSRDELRALIAGMHVLERIAKQDAAAEGDESDMADVLIDGAVAARQALARLNAEAPEDAA